MVDRETILKAEWNHQSQFEGKGGTLCEIAPPVIDFLERLAAVLPWRNAWSKGVAKAAVVLLKKLVESRCPQS